MKRSYLLPIMVLGAMILAGSLAVRAQSDPYEPATVTEPATDTGQAAAQNEPTTPAQGPASTGTATTDTTANDDSMNKQDARMPKTASPLPLIALIGILSLGASLSLRAMSQSANGEADASDR